VLKMPLNPNQPCNRIVLFKVDFIDTDTDTDIDRYCDHYINIVVTVLILILIY